MINKEPIEVEENITTIKSGVGKGDVRDLAKELNDLYDKYIHQNYDRLAASLVIKDGKAALMLVGFRKEKPEETKHRIMVEETKEKRNNEAELKEYLRLKKIYDKKESE